MYCMSMKLFALLNIDYCYDFCKYFCVFQTLFMKETFPCICCCFFLVQFACTLIAFEGSMLRHKKITLRHTISTA